MPLSNTVQIHIISREKSSIHASQRRMERKLKELNATLDQERSQHVEQRDQVNIKICIQNLHLLKEKRTKCTSSAAVESA